ncbi:MAG TPA: protein phosphatase 2C domain-containing protein, partial [Kofleriaceae bacterium]|nr:protein phosphatase 2C domain-containing protein [Kofleriaceae bacterium]
LNQMGSTVAVLRVESDRAVIAHVGDSRVYRLRGATLEQLTVDHSLIAQMIAAGTPPADIDTFPWRHVVTRALGTQSAEPEVQIHAVHAGDRFLLCSDGLSEVLEPAEIAAMLAHAAEPACRALVDAAYAAGSKDNISAIVVAAG